MDVALITSAAVLGLAGTPHCAAMCAAPCAAATAGQGRAGVLAFHLARVASYTVVGTVAASSVETLAAWSQMAPALRPLWTLLHAAAFVLGLWLLRYGRQPAWMGRWGRLPAVVVNGAAASADAAVHPLVFRAAGSGALAASPGSGAAYASANTVEIAAVNTGPNARSGSSRAATLSRARSPWAAFAAGALWAAWPCGLLQSALLVAALTGGAASGAAAMALFAVVSSLGLLLAPWAWRRWLSGANAAARERGLARLGGGLLAAASGWSLTHDLWHRAAVWCGLA